ncbi:ImmA/IrrE family metallo-endopeptidase [Jeotgalibacillus sp. R-1-5s-1]|uniref:ImmA/IrrE family metallo-endopeptidase n=1 Tax=Jeotgalibacillus sp. R-1-5s-1 TaxID=2555897 RepID=UPI00106B876D|nr:ImmA/IrrE family metallo-endopeptidase [Jeotgalibacillus sp. R-1-5s-1]TFD94417.1 ImmA/IrrE family metallo-endopeptidase [Jeotgalibacillus sp. R-1-5s-1]
MNERMKAEKVAEAFASSFLDEAMSHDLFIGSHIERLLADYVHVIYQDVDDPAYFGASITHKSGEQFVALNTFHSLRTRYFTAAHELWHLTEGSSLQDDSFDHERAADRFAAAIMMPSTLTKTLWQKFKKQYSAEEAILHIADMAEVPYVSVVRRVNELTGSVPFLKRKEEEWKQIRDQSGFPASALDLPSRDTRFSSYEKIIKKYVEQQKLDELTAANKLTSFAPKVAERYQAYVLDRKTDDEA